MYNKINVIRHLEERECLNCGKKWTIFVGKNLKSSKRKIFCDECTLKLSNWEKKKIKMQKIEGYREIYLSKKREEYRNTYNMEEELNIPYEFDKKSLENTLLRYTRALFLPQFSHILIKLKRIRNDTIPYYRNCELKSTFS